jgi:hypothetical protein
MASLQKVPHLAKYSRVTLDPRSQPNPEDVAKATVVVRSKLV